MEETVRQKLVLPPVMRYPFPKTIFPRVFRHVHKYCQKHDDVEVFDPYEMEWFDGTNVDDDEMSSVQYYEKYMHALNSSEGPGYPDYVSVSFVDDEVNYGVFATVDIPRGEFIGIYTGELGFGDFYDRDESMYLFEMLDDVIYVDAHRSGNFTRYINHTSPENCNLQSLLYLMEIQRFGRSFTLPIIILYASRPLEKGEQLLYDYGQEYWTLLGVKPQAITPKTFMLN